MRVPRFADRRSAAAFGLAALSGGLLFCAFPPVGAASLGFVGLIPFVWALRLRPEGRGRLSYSAGLVCWVPSLWFLSPVTVPGALMLAAYCALYFVPVGWVWGRFLTTWTPDKPGRAVRLVIGGAAWWCAVESVRGWMLTGFPWNYLGATQWENYALMQLASVGGVLLVSFVLVALNLGIAISLVSLAESVGRAGRARMHPELYAPILILAVAFTWGARELRRVGHAETRRLRVAVVQPLAANKWSEASARDNYRVLWELSDAALSLKPDLLIWPETALPDELRWSERAADLVRSLAAKGTPLLLGSLDFVPEEGQGPYDRVYFNSSFLVDRDGRLTGEYRKKHLVMFGEYMPFGDVFPFLRSLTPMPEDVTPGAGSGVLRVPGEDVGLGMLICFEDLMPYLARELVDEGADVFVNQTNDAWFDPLWGSWSHLANAVFRSVEQRRPTVRATNSGVSAWVDVRGVVRERIEDPTTGRVRLRGFKVFEVEVPADPETTFFHRYPRGFVWLSCGLSLLLVVRRRG